jgi:hypothetical protein
MKNNSKVEIPFYISYDSFREGADEDDNVTIDKVYWIMKAKLHKNNLINKGENRKCPHCNSIECLSIIEAFILLDECNTFKSGYICKCKKSNKHFFLEKDNSEIELKCPHCGNKDIKYYCNLTNLYKLKSRVACEKCLVDTYVYIAPILLSYNSQNILYDNFIKQETIEERITNPYMLTYRYIDVSEKDSSPKRYMCKDRKQIFNTNDKNSALVFINHKGKMYDINNKAKYRKGLTRRCPHCGKPNCKGNIINIIDRDFDYITILNRKYCDVNRLALNVCRCKTTNELFVTGIPFGYEVCKSNIIKCIACGSIQKKGELSIKIPDSGLPIIAMKCKQCNVEIRICFDETKYLGKKYINRIIINNLNRLSKAGYKFKIIDRGGLSTIDLNEIK